MSRHRVAACVLRTDPPRPRAPRSRRPFDQSGVLGVIHGTCDDGTAPLHAQRPGIAGQGIDVVFAGEDQSGRCDLRRVVLRLGCCRGREQCGYRTDIPALRCGQYRSARAHAVTGKGDPIGLDADLSGAESHADADVERRSKICSQSESVTGTGPRSLSGAAATIPQEARCWSVCSYLWDPDHPPVREGKRRGD